MDGFTYSMTGWNHPQDGPDPMCPDLNNTESHNPTWFAFPAWCTNLEMTVSYSNCTSGYDGGCRGIQAAVYSNCSLDPASVVPGGCATSGNQCTNPGVRTININSLIIGKVYYFLVDGCCGSACDIVIDVTSPPCPPTMGPWPGPITEPDTLCVNQTGSYSYQTILGGTGYIWTLDGTITPPPDKIFDDPVASFTRDWTFATPGTYTLCVDGLNDCVPFSADPAPLCKTVTVLGAIEGDITASPNPACPGETVILMTSGYDPNSTKYILVANAAGIIVKVIQGEIGDFTFNMGADFTAYAYNFIPGTQAAPTVGQNVSSLACLTECCMLDNVPFSFQDSEPPVFVNAPGSITYTCFEEIPAIQMLSYTDNCDPNGMVSGTEVASYTYCAGGTLTRMWTPTDICGNVATHVQVITIAPILAATITPPANMTISCSDIPAAGVLPPLSFTNGSAGSCLIAGTIIPTRVDNITACAGTITYTWTATDICGRLIQATQILTVNAPLEAVIQNAPSNANVECVNIPATGVLPVLMYDNGEIGSCRIMGNITPTRVDNITNCSGTITYLWQAIDFCGRVIFHQQVSHTE